MPEAEISIKVPGSARQTLGTFDLPVWGRNPDGAQIVMIEDVVRGMAHALRNQINGLRAAGCSEESIIQLLIDIWPFREAS